MLHPRCFAPARTTVIIYRYQVGIPRSPHKWAKFGGCEGFLGNGRLIGIRKKIHIQGEKWASRTFLSEFVEIGCQEELPQNPQWETKTNSDHSL